MLSAARSIIARGMAAQCHALPAASASLVARVGYASTSGNDQETLDPFTEKLQRKTEEELRHLTQGGPDEEVEEAEEAASSKDPDDKVHKQMMVPEGPCNTRSCQAMCQLRLKQCAELTGAPFVNQAGHWRVWRPQGPGAHPFWRLGKGRALLRFLMAQSPYQLAKGTFCSADAKLVELCGAAT